MSYAVRILKIHDDAEWMPPADNPDSAAGPTVPGAWRARRVSVEISNGVVPLERRDFLVPEPYDRDVLQQMIADYIATLPPRHEDEGLELTL